MIDRLIDDSRSRPACATIATTTAIIATVATIGTIIGLLFVLTPTDAARILLFWDSFFSGCTGLSIGILCHVGFIFFILWDSSPSGLFGKVRMPLAYARMHLKEVV